MNARSATVRRIAAGLAVAAALATSACAAGQQAETSQEKPTLDGNNADVGRIALRGVAVVTPDGIDYKPGSTAQLRIVIVNDGDSADKLTSVSSSAASGWGSYANDIALSDDLAASSSAAAPTPSAPATGTTGSTASPTAAPSSTAVSGTPASAPVTIGAGLAVSYGVPDADGRILALTGLKQTLHPGSTVRITFTFANAGSTTIPVPVEISDAGSYTPPASYIPSSAGNDSAGQ